MSEIIGTFQLKFTSPFIKFVFFYEIFWKITILREKNTCKNHNTVYS